jgi:predicted O-methyltransferase YrrM
MVETALVVVRNIILGGNLASLTLLTRPRLWVTYVSECLFMWKTLDSRRGIPQKNVFEVLTAKDVETVRLGNLQVEQSAWFWPDPSYATDIISLCLICQILKPRVVFEIGTFKGYTSLHFALNTPDDSQVYTLDLPKDGAGPLQLKTTVMDSEHTQVYRANQEYYFEHTEFAPRVHRLMGDSATFDFAPYHGKVDFFFIDGAHSYEYVRSDTLNALECCHPGSVIAWHDFGRVGVNGVSRWIVEFAQGREIYSVPGSSIAFMVVNEGGRSTTP